MSFPRVFALGTMALFLLIAVVAGVRKLSTKPKAPAKELTLSGPVLGASGETAAVDLVAQLFTTGPDKLPIVETVTYESAVAWLKGRPAWIGDYATYYATSRHFIARSLNGRPDYFTQKISPGQKFNVFRKDKNFSFFLVADLSRCKMAFYLIDLDANERLLLKTYTVGVGKPGATPVGQFTLGDKIGVYKPGIMGTLRSQEVEMIRVFGTRWIPFGSGLGIHGAPWGQDPESGEWIESKGIVGCAASDGSIQMRLADMEELFSIVITRPTILEVVPRFEEAYLPGIELQRG